MCLPRTPLRAGAGARGYHYLTIWSTFGGMRYEAGAQQGIKPHPRGTRYHLSIWGTPIGNVSCCTPLRLFRLEFALEDSHQ